VRRLDTAQRNVVATIDRITLLLTSRSCVAAIQSALNDGRYEEAAEAVGEYQRLMHDASKGAGHCGWEAELPGGGGEIVKSARERLLEVVRERVAAAESEGSLGAVGEIIRLYQPLDVGEEGLEVTKSFLRRCALSLRSPTCSPPGGCFAHEAFSVPLYYT
jgi:hypothetical protein